MPQGGSGGRELPGDSWQRRAEEIRNAAPGSQDASVQSLNRDPGLGFRLWAS